MARSKNIHIVQHTIEVTQPDDPSADWANGVLQVDVNLSELFGRTVRNGNQFRLIGYGSTLKGYSGAVDQDTGFAGVVGLNFCPVTKNSVAAHQKMYKQWMRQKQLSSSVGEYVRYDDFEVGWSSLEKLPVARNSTIRSAGLDDASSESVVIYGTSADGDRVTLESFYNRLNPIADPSTDPFGTVIKTAKFVDKFPDQRVLLMPTSFSAQVDENPPLDDAYVGGIATGEMQWLPSDNHLSHMTGTLFYYFKGVAQDTGSVFADTLRLTITLAYEGWSSIAPDTKKPTRTRSQVMSSNLKSFGKRKSSR